VERTGVEQEVDPLTSQELPAVVLALARHVGARSEGLFLALLEVGEPLAHRVVGHACKR
jgi:hypothetical protein